MKVHKIVSILIAGSLLAFSAGCSKKATAPVDTAEAAEPQAVVATPQKMDDSMAKHSATAKTEARKVWRSGLNK
ncbi:MAG: hypothetical protein HQL70_09815 [Magnetococcales bacterium]|nr:hypothetical protein [Magnetococcales bacterium]